MLPDSLSLWFILSPGPPAACTACWPAANLQASLGKTYGEKIVNISPQSRRGTQVKGSPRRQPAHSLATPIANNIEPAFP